MKRGAENANPSIMAIGAKKGTNPYHPHNDKLLVLARRAREKAAKKERRLQHLEDVEARKRTRVGNKHAENGLQATEKCRTTFVYGSRGVRQHYRKSSSDTMSPDMRVHGGHPHAPAQAPL